MKLRETIRNVQLLENDAADKAGMRFLLFDEDKMFGDKYIADYIKTLLEDIQEQILAAPKLGQELAGEVLG